MKIVFKSLLVIVTLMVMVCLTPAVKVQAQSTAKADSNARIFTYQLQMENVDTSDGARPYPSDTRRGSLIGFNESFTATKRLPYKVGPGKVRVYLSAFPEGDEKKLSVTIAGQTQSAIHSSKTPRYSWHELVFDLKKPQDMLEFKAENVDGGKHRIIWYSTIVTNDPELNYVEVSKNKYKLRRHAANYINPKGNLVPNSGFEQGIQDWDVTNYKSNIMVKPSLLNKRSADGQLSLDVGKIPVTSRWFKLEKGQTYNLSYYAAADNTVPVEASLESQAANSKISQMIQLDSTQAVDSPKQGWKRVSATFTIPLEAQEDGNDDAGDSNEGNAAGNYRLIFHAPGSKTQELVDSVQITQGQSLEPYAFNQGLEANFISPSTQAIYLLDAPGDMYFNLASDKNVAVKKITYEITDYFDRVVASPAELNLTQSGQLPVTLPTNRAGIFRVRTHITYATDGQTHTVAREFFYNVVYPSAPRTNRMTWSQLGGYFTNAPKGPFSYAEVANRFGIYEFNTLGHQMGRWKANMARDPKNPSKYLRGQYNFSSSDKELEKFTQANFNTIVNLHVNGASSSYGVPFELAPEPGPVFEFKKNVRFAQKDWLDFVTAYVTHFKGRIKRYEVQDEPYQYFAADKYAEFYLATYKAIKKADPDALVFIHNAHGKMDYIDELNKLTDGKAYEYMDGVYLYLTQQHSGRVSRTAVPEFRAWAKKHNLPILTATCFSPGEDFSTHSLDQAPDYLSERENEFRSIQHFFDGLIWGGAQSFYFYYGSHPAGSYASLFDKYGQIIPMIHFYSAANALVGDHTNVTSIDDFDQLRIGVVETERKKTYAILYSVDGKLYDLAADGGTFEKSLDGFGNPTTLNKADGKVHVVVGPQPIYLLVKDAAAAVAVLKASNVKESVDVDFSYQRRADGVLELQALMTSKLPLKAWTDLHDVYRREMVSVGHSQPLGDNLYELVIPLPVSPFNTLNNNYYLKMSSNQGDLYASYKNTYAPLLEKTPVIDGKYSANEWPLYEAQTIPLGGYYLTKGQDEKKPFARGEVALTNDAKNLYGMAAIYNSHRDYTITLEIAPREARTGRVLNDQITSIIIKTKTGSINGSDNSNLKIARSKLSTADRQILTRATELVEFSIPLADLPGFKISDGLSYALRIKANDPPLPEATKGKIPSWYLDASWPAPLDVNAPEEPARWGTLLVVH